MRPQVSVLSLSLCLLINFLSPMRAIAERASALEMETVCRNWLAYVAAQPGGWAGETRPAIAGVSEIRGDGLLLAHAFHILPRGNVVVPTLKEMPPIKTYSEEFDLDVLQEGGFPRLLRDDIESRFALYESTYGSLDARQPDIGPVLFDRGQRDRWETLLADPVAFSQRLGSGSIAPRTQVGPLLTSAWDQGYPYNDLCPMGDGGRTVVGCVATAVAQVMRYHQWPPRGLREYQYLWDGDNSCGGQTGGEWLYADFSDSYDWANMPDDCGGYCTPAQREALAELCYEVGVSVVMDYGRCASAAYTEEILTSLPAYFRYDASIQRELRNSYNAAGWFELIRTEINSGRPMVYTFTYEPTMGHAIVCDGWRDSNGQNEYHMNYGWSGAYTAWYVIDNIFHTVDPLTEKLFRRIMPSQTGSVFTIRPDGSGDYGTIQDAVDAAIDGDSIVLTDGTFAGERNRDIDTGGKVVTIRSASGHPEACIIDCEGDPESRRGFLFHSGEDASTVVEGITVMNGFVASGEEGGGILCINGSSPMIRSCVFLANRAQHNLAGGDGGGLACVGSNPSLVGCVFKSNEAAGPLGDGGGVHLSGSSSALTECVFLGNLAGGMGGGLAIDGGSHPSIVNCTFHANESWAGPESGGGIWVADASSASIDRCIIGFTSNGCAVGCEGAPGSATLTCCDVYGNVGGDWAGCIAGQGGTNGNMALDPLYCDRDAWNLGLTEASPCAPGNNLDCGLVGALPVGCGTIHVHADGSGDYPTIQAAIDAASPGYVIELADGVYTGPGNRDLSFRGKAIRVASESGEAETCIIDCGGNPSYPRRGVSFVSGEGAGSILSGVTITNGYESAYSGGAIECKNGSSPTIENCRIIGNTTVASGGGLYCNQSHPTIRGCTFAGNRAGNGGGLYLNTYGATITLDHCTISGNEGTWSGGGITCYSAVLQLSNSIVSFSTQGAAVSCFYSTATLTCCDVFGNLGGDYVDCIQGQQGVTGNLNTHPCFCEPETYDFRLASSSQCTEENNPTCGRIGAYGVGCEVVHVEPELQDLHRGVTLWSAVPNPFADETRIRCFIPAESVGAARGSVRLRIIDAAGRSVRSLVDGGLAAGMHEIVWDGREDSGRALPAGAYLCELKVGRAVRSTRLVLLRF